MSVLANGVTLRYDLLIDIHAPGPAGATEHHRFSVGPRSVTIGAGDHAGVYDNRVVQTARLREERGDGPFPHVVFSDVQFRLVHDRTYGAAASFLDFLLAHAGSTGTIHVDAYLSTGATCFDSDRVFAGYLLGDSTVVSDEWIDVRAKDVLAIWETSVHTAVFDDVADGIQIAGYQPDDSVRGEALPILYGRWEDWQSRFQLRAPLIRQPSAAYDAAAKLCDPGGGTIGAISADGRYIDSAGQVVKTAVTDMVNLVTGEFVLTNTTDVDFGRGDTVAPRTAQGVTDGSIVIEKPADIIRDLLVRYAGVTPTLVDDVSFALIAAAQSHRFRCYLRETTPVFDLVSEICRDAGLVLCVRDGLFVLETNRIFVWPGEDDALLRLDRCRVGTSQRLALKPEAWDYGRVRLLYKLNPATGRFERSVTLGTGGGPTLTVESRWIWRDVDAQNIIGMMH